MYRGTGYVISKTKLPEKYEPVIYDCDGFPVRWVPATPPKPPMGFHLRRDES